MILYKFLWVVLNCWVFSLLMFKAHGDAPGISVKFLKAPNSFSRRNSASFLFEVVGGNGTYTGFNITCKLDYGARTDCGGKEVSYTGLHNGNHKFEVCSNESPGVACYTYNWIVDRRNVSFNISSPAPEKLLQLDSGNMTVRATNNPDDLKLYLNFSERVPSSSAEVQNSLNASDGKLLPINEENLGNQTYGFKVVNVSSPATINITFDSKPIITFCYDSQRPEVRLRTRSKTMKPSISVSVLFSEPVFGFDIYSLSISGGKLLSLEKNVNNTLYIVRANLSDDIVYVRLPENVTQDVAGNENLPSASVRVRHYGLPIVAVLTSAFQNLTFGITCFAAGLLTVSTASRLSATESSGPSSSLTSGSSSSSMSDFARILYRSIGHIQLIALSRWLVLRLPVNYYEFARGLEWSIPYFNFPSRKGHGQKGEGSSNFRYSENLGNEKARGVSRASALTRESRKTVRSLYFKDSKLKRWRDFKSSMFWLGVIGGSLILLHILIILFLKFRRIYAQIRTKFGVLMFPIFEICLLILALPCFCKAAAGLVGGGGEKGVIVGSLLLGVVSVLLLSFFLFLTVGVVFGKLHLYEEGQEFHWFEFITRLVRGNHHKQDDSIMAPDEKEEAGAPGSHSQKEGDEKSPSRRKLICILMTYYTPIEIVRQVTLAILAGAYEENMSSKSPTTIILSITSFQLFFLVLKNFVTKTAELVEIIVVAGELGLFALCLLPLEKDLSVVVEKIVGMIMILLVFIGYLAYMIKKGYYLYKQTKLLDQDKNSFLRGLKIALSEFRRIFIPWKRMENREGSSQPGDGGNVETGSPVDKNRSSGITDKDDDKTKRTDKA